MRRGVVPIGKATGVRDPDQTCHDRGSVETEQGEYAHLVALQHRYAKLALGDPQRQRLRAQLTCGYVPVAEHIARRFAGRGEPLEDLVLVATLGLVNAVDRFEPNRGCDFLAFAVPTITGELRRYLRDHGWSARVPRRRRSCTAIRSSQTELARDLLGSADGWLARHLVTVTDQFAAGNRTFVAIVREYRLLRRHRLGVDRAR